MRHALSFLSIVLLCLISFSLISVPGKSHAEIPKIHHFASSRGIEAWIIEDHYLPIVSIRLAFRYSGSAYDPKNKHGLAFMVANLLDEGSGNLSSLEFHKQLERLATTISFDADADCFYVSVNTLSTNLSDVLLLLRKTLQEPRFDPPIVERVRNQLIADIVKQAKTPNYIASQHLAKAIYGHHPYALPTHGNITDIKSLTIEDLKTFTQQHFTLDNMIMGIAGDIHLGRLGILLDRTFKTLPSKNQLTLTLPPVQYPTRSDDIHINYPVSQNIIAFGFEGILRHDPRFYAAYVINYILGGGGFESRLMQIIREDRGLAYSTSSSIEFNEQSGTWTGAAATRTAESAETISLIRKILSDLKKQGITQDELEGAKQYLVGSFPLKLVSNANLAGFLVVMQRDNLGINFLEKRNEYIQALTLEEVNLAAKELIKPEQLMVVTVGK